MKTITLLPKEQPKARLWGDLITPDMFAGKNIREIESLPIFCGNREAQLGEFFDISGSAAESAKDLCIVIDGDVSRTKRIGQGMKNGSIIINGNADMYVGAGMKGGQLIVKGNADAFAGQQLEGGELIIQGNAGDCLGASYRGDWRGMKGGRIVVRGNAGNEIGGFMVGGHIHILGNCGPFAGVHMRKGLIVVEGRVSECPGAQMIGGNLIAGCITSMLPSFEYEKEKEDIEIDGKKFEGIFQAWSGDHAELRAKGKLYVKKEE
jgi:formylmethanofuran dehydrogenase subunit C